MRTPGRDRELTVGFLLAERLIRGSDDLALIEHCADAANDNVVNVRLADDRMVARALESRREVASTSSCGVCGRQTIETLTADMPAVQSSMSMSWEAVAALPSRLRAAQPAFEETGGLHAAGLFSAAGDPIDVAEDVGRHNAVDKVIGRCVMRDDLPLSAYALCVSGRTSFEIVQKAAVAGIPLLAAVSAPSSLAIDLAVATGITLVGFSRGNSFNIYAGGERIR